VATRQVFIKLGDKDRQLSYKFGDAKELVRVTGKGVQQILAAFVAGDLDTTSHALRIGLRRENPKLGKDQDAVDDLIQVYLSDGGTVGKLNDAIVDALQASHILRDQEGEKTADPQ
jgi:hypothetical protein